MFYLRSGTIAMRYYALWCNRDPNARRSLLSSPRPSLLLPSYQRHLLSLSFSRWFLSFSRFLIFPSLLLPDDRLRVWSLPGVTCRHERGGSSGGSTNRTREGYNSAYIYDLAVATTSCFSFFSLLLYVLSFCYVAIFLRARSFFVPRLCTKRPYTLLYVLYTEYCIRLTISPFPLVLPSCIFLLPFFLAFFSFSLSFAICSFAHNFLRLVIQIFITTEKYK